jgi:hypothetical protein
MPPNEFSVLTVRLAFRDTNASPGARIELVAVAELVPQTRAYDEPIVLVDTEIAPLCRVAAGVRVRRSRFTVPR